MLAATNPFNVGGMSVSSGFVLHGGEEFDQTGFSVSSIGDFNGDGFDDVVVTAPLSDGGATDAGEAYVVFGASSGPNLNISPADLNGRNGFTMRSFISGAGSGLTIAGGGDFNNDGMADIAIGQPFAEHFSIGQAGTVTIVFGTRTTHSAVETLGGGTNGSIVLIGDEVGSEFGRSVSLDGDVNGDGFADLVIGAPAANGGSVGAAFVFFGRALASNVAGGPGQETVSIGDLDGSNGFRVDGSDAAGFLGSAVAHARDVNGDGYGDVVIGSPAADNLGTNDGVAHVAFGHSGEFAAALSIADLDGSNGFELRFGGENERLGTAVASAGDFNRDGFDDLVIGTDVHHAFVVFGQSEFESSHTLLQIGQVGGLGGAILTTGDGHRLSHSVAGGFDFNGDGFDDVILGAPDADPLSTTNGGKAFVLFGTASISNTFSVASLDGNNGFVIQGEASDDFLGLSVSAAGDFNGDGFDEVLIGASPLPGFIAGDTEAYLIYGGNVTPSGSTQVGNESANTLNGTVVADRLIGGRGNDRLNGLAGADVLIGGQGDDVLSDSLISVDHLRGGRGLDTLLFNGVTLDLTELPDNQLRGIERFDLTGATAQRVIVSPLDVLNLSDDSNTLTIAPGTGDSILFVGEWAQNGTTLIGRQRHAVMQSGAAQVLVPVTAALGVVLPDGGGDYELLQEGSEIVLRDTSGIEWFRAARPTNATFEVVGSAGDDRLSVIFDNGSPLPALANRASLTFDGGGEQSIGGDSLLLVGTPVGGMLQRSTITTTIGNESVGSSALQLDGLRLQTHNVEGLSDFLAAARRDIKFDTAPSVTDHDIDIDGSDAGDIVADVFAGAFTRQIHFAAPTTMLTIRGSSLADNFDVTAWSDEIEGTVSVLGGAGNDRLDFAPVAANLTLLGETGNDSLFGGIGNDSLNGGNDNDLLIGNSGNDTLIGGTGNDLADGGDDDDSVRGDSGNDSLTGGAGADVVIGGDGNDAVSGDGGTVGDHGNDTLTGDAGNDTLSGEDGDDSLNGGVGTNLFLATGGEGEDTIAGALGTQATNTLRLSLGTFEGVSFTNTTAQLFTLAEERFSELTLLAIDRLDVVGNELDNTVTAAGFGGDRVTLSGGDGNDSLTGGLLADNTLNGGDGNDRLVGGNFSDRMIGGAGSDTYRGGATTNDANDIVVETVANNLRLGTLTQPGIPGQPSETFGQIVLLTGATTDETNLFLHIEILELSGDGTNNRFELLTATPATTLRVNGLGGNDTVVTTETIARTETILFDGGTGTDRLEVTGISANATATNSQLSVTGGQVAMTSVDQLLLDGSSSNNNLNAATFSGDVTLRGQAGADTLTGGSGDDFLDGGVANDVLNGGAGDDTLTGSVGSDQLNGGDGIDQVTETSGGLLTLTGTSTRATLTGGIGIDTLVGVEGLDFTGSSDNQVINAQGSSLNVTIDGGSGNDTIFGGSGNDFLRGGLGNDSLVGNDGEDTLIGDAGADSLRGGNDDDTLQGGDGIDNLDGGNGSDTRFGTDNPSDVAATIEFVLNVLFL